MRAGSPALSLAIASVLSLTLPGCTVPTAPGSPDYDAAGTPNALTVLPGTNTVAMSLLLPQSTAFAILGRSCGGIQEKAYATGFDVVGGLPTGFVYMQTRCGGSGRGGGYHTTTYSAWAAVTWDFAGNVVSSVELADAPTVDPTFTTTDAYGDSLQNISLAAYLVVPAPSAPTGVAAVQAGDELRVSWTFNGVNPVAVVSSTLTATPLDSTASILTATVTGSATTGLVGPLQPQTAYRVTVVNSTVGGDGAASAPIEVTTATASIPPSAPGAVAAKWAVLDPTGTTDTIIVSWTAAVPGDSPIDQYQVGIRGSDGAGTFTQKVSGGTFTASFTVDYLLNWGAAVRAHNAVGWGPWSAVARLGGL
jgi:hypothetical protein